MKSKLIISLVTVLSIVSSNSLFISSGLTKKISDIDNHWAKDYINEFIDQGYINGYEDGTFRPENQITRAEFVVIFNRKFNLTNSSGKQFEDTKDHWAKDAVEGVIEKGYMNGYTEDNTFRPNKNITRAETVVTLSRVPIDLPAAEGGDLPSMEVVPEENKLEIDYTLGDLKLSNYNYVVLPIEFVNNTENNVTIEIEDFKINGHSYYVNDKINIAANDRGIYDLYLFEVVNLDYVDSIEGKFVVTSKDVSGYDIVDFSKIFIEIPKEDTLVDNGAFKISFKDKLIDISGQGELVLRVANDRYYNMKVELNLKSVNGVSSGSSYSRTFVDQYESKEVKLVAPNITDINDLKDIVFTCKVSANNSQFNYEFTVK